MFEAATDRVLMKRSEFEELFDRTRQIRREIEAGKEKPPTAFVMISSDYEIEIHDQRTVIHGVLEIELLTDDPVAVPLALNRVMLLEAVDETAEKPAAIGTQQNAPEHLLILEGRRRHRIRLRMATPLEIDSTRQRLAFRVPQAPQTSLKLSVPGDVELKSGASVLSRNVEDAKTRFELLLPPNGGEVELLMTLNSHRAGSYSAVQVRSVQFAEVTEQYERLHVTVSLNEQHQGVREVSFFVPAGFEMTDVRSVLLDRWDVRKTEAAGDGDVLNLRFREQVPGLTTIRLSAIRTGAKIGTDWFFPMFEPVSAATCTSVLGLLVDTELDISKIRAENLFPIDTMTLKDAIPPTALDALPGSPSIRLALAWYLPQRIGTVTASFRRPEAECRIEAEQMLTLSEDYPSLSFLGTLSPQAGRVFEIVLDGPENWKITSVADSADQPLTFRPRDDGKIAVRLPHGVGPGEKFGFRFEAVGTVPGWFDDVSEKSLQYPVFRIEGAGTGSGRVLIRSKNEEDWEILPLKTENITQLDTEPGEAFDLSLRYPSTPFSLELLLKKLEPRVKARTFSFYRFEPKLLRVRHEVEYLVEQAKTRSLTFELPGDAPATPNITGLDGLEIKETFCEELIGQDAGEPFSLRLWKVTLAKPVSGRLRLAVNFEQPIDEALYEKPDAGVLLPRLTTRNTAWQSGVMAIEGDEELDLTLPPETAELIGKPRYRPVDAGVLGPTAYKPGNRLLGVFTTFDSPISVGIRRNATVELPEALVRNIFVTARPEPAKRMSFSTIYQVRYELQIGAGAVKAALDNSNTLWSVTLDGEPVKPQRVENDMLIPIPARPGADARQLVFLYRAETASVHQALSFPVLRLAGKDVPIPVMRTSWSVLPPPGWQVVRLGDKTATETPPQPALFDLFRRTVGFFEILAWRPQLGCSAKQAVYLRHLGVETIPVPASPYFDAATASISLEEDSPRDSAANAAKQQDPFHALDMSSAIPESLEEAKKEARKEAEPVYTEKLKDLKGRRTSSEKIVSQSRRLQSAQPVTVVVEWDATEHGLNAADIGDRAVQTMPIRLASVDTARRWAWLAGFAVLLVGTLGLRWPRRRKSAYVFGLMALGTLAAFVPGPDSWTLFWNGIVYGAALAGAVFLAEALCRFVRKERHGEPFVQKTSVALTVLLLLAVPAAYAGETEDEPKIVLPGDALIVPYKADSAAADRLPEPDGLTRPDQSLLVPLEMHRNLLQLLEDRLPKPTLPVTHTVSSARYEATIPMGSENELLLEGTVRIDVLTDRPVLVPLVLEGGVLVNPRLDGRPASLLSRSVALSMLLVEGAGPHELAFSVRFPLQRQGGWRIVAGKIPAAAGTTVSLRFPEAAGDLLTGNPLDKRKWETGKIDLVETAPMADGSIRWQWRTAVSEAGVDRNLEVESAVRMDLQEDGCHVRWMPVFRIARGRWEMLRLNLPNDFVLVDISGENVRGWSVADEEGARSIDVELLKPAEKTEKLFVQLVKPVDAAGETLWKLPKLSVPEAGIHRGRIDLFRSASRSLRIENSSGLSPTDATRSEFPASGFDGASPLGMMPFLSYRFVSEAHDLTVRSEPVREERTVAVETVLKLTRQEFLVETKFRLTGSDKPFCARLRLPKDFVLADIEKPAGLFWNRDGEEFLNLSCGDGFSGPLEILLTGRLETPNRTVLETLPRFEIDFVDLAAEKVACKTSIAVLTEPSLDVRAENADRCRVLPPDRVFSWLTAPEQRELVRLALEGEADPQARLVLSERKPEIRCSTITNIRTTAEAVEETTLLDFTITRAGVRRLVFLLPERPEDVTIEAPMLRRKTVKLDDAEDALASMGVTLELQDEIIGQYRVLVKTDRPLRPETDYDVIVPIIPDDPAARQYIVLENDPRSPDEMVVDPARLVNLRPLNRQQNEWHYLASILGGNVTEAYCRSSAADTVPANLRFRMRRREAVRLAEARIDLAETRILLGENGSYRAEQVYRIDNKKEPYLDLLLPENASLWGVRILDAGQWNRKKYAGANESGRPVKPCMMPPDVAAGYPSGKGKPENRLIRIPLIKTESGDPDYVIRLVYAGEVPKLRNLSKLDMPFITVLNVPVGQSLVRLHLPDGYDYRFDGSLEQVAAPREQEASKRAETDYRRRQEDRLRQVLSSDNPYAANRARFNLDPRFSHITKVDTFRYSGEDDSSRAGGEPALGLRGKAQATWGAGQRMSKSGQGAQVISKAARIDYPDAEVVDGDTVHFSANSVTIEKQFQSQMNKRSNDAVSQKALSLNSNTVNGTVVLSGVNHYSGGTNAGFDQRWLDQGQLSNSFTANDPVSVGGAIDASGSNVVQQPMPQQIAQPYPPGQAAGYRPVIDPQKPQDMQMNQPAIPQSGRSMGQTSQLGRPLNDPPPMRQQARNIEVRDGNIVLGNRSQTGGESSDRQVGYHSGEEFLSDRRSGMGAMGGGRESERGTVSRRSFPTTAAPTAPALPAPVVEPKPRSEPVTVGLPAEKGQAAAGNGGAVYYGGSTVGGVPVVNGAAIVSGKEAEINVGDKVMPEPVSGIQEMSAPVAGLSTRSASLDIEIPASGRSYLFTTPQGTLELSVRPVSGRLASDAPRFGAALLGLVLLYGVYRLCLAIGSRWTFDRRTHRNLAALITLFGCLSLLLAPMVFLLSMIVAGILWTTLLRRAPASAPLG